MERITLQTTLSFGCDVIFPALSLTSISNLKVPPFSIETLHWNISSFDGGPERKSWLHKPAIRQILQEFIRGFIK